MKRKGDRTERELLHMLWEAGFACIRTAGSGNTSELATDLIAGKNGRVLAIECKSGKREIKRYLKKEQIDGLKEFSKTFGAEPWIGMKFDYVGWLFLKPEHLEKLKSGYLAVDLKLTKEKGIKFEDLTG